MRSRIAELAEACSNKKPAVIMIAGLSADQISAVCNQEQV